MLRRMLMLGLAAYLLTATDVAQSLGRKKRENEQIKAGLIENGLLLQAAIAQGKAIIFFVEPADAQRWKTADGKHEFTIRYFGRDEPPPGSGVKKLNYIYSSHFVAVDPGTYHVLKISQDLHKTRHVDASTHKTEMKDAIGRIAFINTQFSEWYASSSSYDEIGHQEQVVVGQTCGGGTCGAIYQDQYVVDRPAGRIASTHEAMEDGVVVSVDYPLEQSPANITVQAGEVVFAGSLRFRKNESFSWDAAKCGAATDAILECPLTGYRVARMDTRKNLETLRAELKKQFWGDEMLQMIKYRPLKMNARRAEVVSDREEIYEGP